MAIYLLSRNQKKIYCVLQKLHFCFIFSVIIIKKVLLEWVFDQTFTSLATCCHLAASRYLTNCVNCRYINKTPSSSEPLAKTVSHGRCHNFLTAFMHFTLGNVPYKNDCLFRYFLIQYCFKLLNSLDIDSLWYSYVNVWLRNELEVSQDYLTLKSKF